MGGAIVFYLPEKLKKVDSYFLEAVTNFLTAHPYCILRELKKEFTSVQGFDQKLETLILAGLIKREDRRYSVVVPSFPIDFPFKPLMHDLVDPLWKNLPEGISFSNVYNGTKLPKRQYSLQVSPELREKMSPYLWDKKEFFGKCQLTEWQNQVSQTTVTNYFKGKRDTKKLYDLEKLLGDVDVHYYLEQSLPKLFRAQKHPLKESRRDIFTESLVTFGLLTEELTPQVNFEEETTQEEISGALKGDFLKILTQLPYQENPAIYEHLTFLTQGYFLTSLVEQGYFNIENADEKNAYHFQSVKKI